MWFGGLQSGWKCFYLVTTKLNEVAVDGNSNAAAGTPVKAEVSPEAKDVNPSTDLPALASEESMSEFITQVASLGLQSGWKCFYLVTTKLNEVAVDGNSNAAAGTPVKAEVSPEAKDVNPSTDLPALASEESMSEFITQVASLVKYPCWCYDYSPFPFFLEYTRLYIVLSFMLVDSKDIVELQTKQLDCELYICKKEALPPPPTPATMMQSHSQCAVRPSLPTPSPAPIPAYTPAPTPARSAPEVKKSSSSFPPLKCPMAGTFYRSPAPGEPPLVKADQSGTIVEILVKDGKPVIVDAPLFLIEP
ncbi:unnamed protein product [Fraxinus pennsylvanica]|uniref:Biotin carboxyl carrier protein n=1 Tax=Fraxinus pennsylvanica TaxID=56036 RepID=A0AAD1ZQB3_9LAMI|nr:unnamed protein product [Fraxinus pennsylvanica]